MKLLSWNIGGAHVFNRKISNALNDKNYGDEDVEYFSKQIKEIQADVVLLQEAHSSENNSQGKVFAEKIAYPYSREHSYGNSHIKKGQQLTLVTLSKYPIQHSYFHTLPNPGLKVQRINGEDFITLDMGFLVTEVLINNRKVNLANCHLIPFQYFNRHFSEPDFQNMRDDLSLFLKKLTEHPSIVGGDFNYAHLEEVVPSVFLDKLYSEAFVDTETAPGKGQQDHILFTKDWNLDAVRTEKLQADHYQCIAEIALQ
jgi:endonuclease/exonuclease/phosphatase family metal-dependent hydrolase